MFGGSLTLGGVLAGYGSTADVTLENRTNTPALEVLGNSTNVYMPGSVWVLDVVAHRFAASGEPDDVGNERLRPFSRRADRSDEQLRGNL